MIGIEGRGLAQALGVAGEMMLGALFTAAGLAMTPAVRWAQRRQEVAVTVTGTAVPQAA